MIIKAILRRTQK